MQESGPIQSRRNAIVKKILEMDSIPSPSPLLLQLIEMAADEDVSPSALARIVEQDPGLATRLLRLVNSAFYGARMQVSSISRAIMMLGINRLRMLALSISLRDAFPLGRVEGMDYEYFWKTSLYRGLLAQALTERLEPGDISPEEAFATGLILEIGLPLLFHACPDKLKSTFPGGIISLQDALAWEEEHLGVHHREIGFFMLEQWRFPQFMTDQQRRFGVEAMAEKQALGCRIVEYARTAAQVFFGDRSDFGVILDRAPSLGIGSEDVHAVVTSCFAKVEAAAEQLLLKVDSEKDLLEVMEKANRALADISARLDQNLERFGDCGPERASRPAGQQVDPPEKLLDAVAHEIRNPLTAIGGFARRLVQGAEEQTELSKYARIILSESQRLERVMAGFSSLSKVYTPVGKPMNLAVLLAETVASLQSAVEPAAASVELESDDTAIPVEIDEPQIRKALEQILTMSVQSLRSPEAGIRIHTERLRDRVEIIAELHGGRLHPRMKDILSLQEKNLSALEMDFDLLLAKKVIEAHKGRLEVRDPEAGQRLAVCLPLAES